MRTIRWAGFFAAFVTLWSSTSASGAAPIWKPQDNVEVIVGAGPGGGNDNVARQLQRIMQERRLVETPSTVVNKTGGGGTIAYTYLNQRRGNAHYIALASNTLITNHITGISPINYSDFTPLAILINEYISLVVRAESPLKTGHDLIAKLKVDPASVVFGISTSLGNINHIAVAVVARVSGIDVKKLRVVVFDSSASSVAAVLGGHVDVVAGPPSISASHIEAGKLRVIGITSPQRLRGKLANQPTWREQGVDAVVVNWRGVLGAGGIGAAQIAYWDETLSKVTATDEWNQDLERKLWENAYANSAGTAQYLKTQYDDMKRIMLDLGFAK